MNATITAARLTNMTRQPVGTSVVSALGHDAVQVDRNGATDWAVYLLDDDEGLPTGPGLYVRMGDPAESERCWVVSSYDPSAPTGPRLVQVCDAWALDAALSAALHEVVAPRTARRAMDEHDPTGV